VKKLVLVYPRQVYRSTVAGGLVTFHHTTELSDVLGQADRLRVQPYLHGRTSAQTLVTLKAFQSARPRQEGRCEETGAAIGSPQSITALGDGSYNIAGDFHGRAELVLEIDSSDSNLQEADLEVRVTLFLDS